MARTRQCGQQHVQYKRTPSFVDDAPLRGLYGEPREECSCPRQIGPLVYRASFMRLVPMLSKLPCHCTSQHNLICNAPKPVHHHCANSTHTATQAGPAYASAGQTCDARLINSTCTTYMSRTLRKKKLEGQAMSEWNSKVSTHQRMHHEQPINA